MLIRLIFPANEKTCKAAQISENAVDDHLHEWVPYRLGTWWVQFPVGCTGSAIHSAPESCALKRGAQQRWPWSAPAHFCMTCGQGAPLVRLPIPHRPHPFPVTAKVPRWSVSPSLTTHPPSPLRTAWLAGGMPLFSVILARFQISYLILQREVDVSLFQMRN